MASSIAESVVKSEESVDSVDSDIPDATAILPWLYVGSQQSITRDRIASLVQKGVTHVLSVMCDIQTHFAHEATRDVGSRSASEVMDHNVVCFEYMYVEAEEKKTTGLTERFQQICDFIHRAKMQVFKTTAGRLTGERKCMVYCQSGHSASVTAVCAYLMNHESYSLGEALEQIKSRLPAACPTSASLSQLVRLELTLRDGVPSDLRQFPSLPHNWAFITWLDPQRLNQRFISCHGRLLTVKYVSRHPRIAVISGFLTKQEAKDVIDVAAPQLHPSLVVRYGMTSSHETKTKSDRETTTTTTFTPGERTQGRTSWSCRVHAASHPAVKGAIQRAAFLSNLTPAHAEPAQVVRYLPGQQYMPHYDWFDPVSSCFEEKTQLGGQRATTTLCYLCEPQSGGQTNFPKLKLAFEPKIGDAVFWWNIDEAGKEDQMTLHAGEPVTEGEKWALNIWLRVKPRREVGIKSTTSALEHE